MKNEGRVSKAVISQLPDAADVKKVFEEDPQSVSAIAFLYVTGSIGSNSSTSQPTPELVLQISECFYDLLNEPLVDLAFQAVQTSSMMYDMNVVWASMEQAEESTKHTIFNQVVSDVEGWASNSGEYAYVALLLSRLQLVMIPKCGLSSPRFKMQSLDAATTVSLRVKMRGYYVWEWSQQS